MPASVKKVVVIGAGPSGLVAVKELLEEGHDVTCFEKAKDLGGVYRYDKNSGGVFESTQLTSSVLITCFSDFPPPANAPLHFHHREYLQYLQDYKEQFRLQPHIHFEHTVKQATLSSDGQWQLKIQDEANNKEMEYQCDALAVCSGAHQIPFFPEIPRQNDFKGQILHSNTYKTPESFKDKKVVIVGAGESASDISDEVSKVTAECALSIRRGALILPRLIFGSPNDYYTNRLFYTVPDWLLRIKHASPVHWPSILLISLFLLLLIGLSFLLDEFLSWASGYSLIFTDILNLLGLGFIVYVLFKFSKLLVKEIPLGILQVIGKLMRASGAGHGEQFATKSEGLARSLAQERCVLKPDIKEFTENEIVFTDGSRFATDTVLFCTGYQLTFPFLEMNGLDLRTLYKNCFHKDFGSKLCFIGFARPAIGAIPPISEMQARWFARLLSGDCSLPEGNVLNKEINEDIERHKQNFRAVSDRITGLVNYTQYMDELADFIDCKPKFNELLKRPALLARIYGNPFSGCQYRLRGPHANSETAMAILKRTPFNLIKLIYNGGLCVLILVAEALYRCGLRIFKPNLRLPLGLLLYPCILQMVA